jgi:hypothetical protein
MNSERVITNLRYPANMGPNSMFQEEREFNIQI